MINVHNMDRLIDALRSGNYEQGQHTMKSADNKLCCLGVAHECLIGPISSDHEKRLIRLTEPEYIAVEKALGLPHDAKYRLAAMNDSGNKSFEDIANFLAGIMYAATNVVNPEESAK